MRPKAAPKVGFGNWMQNEHDCRVRAKRGSNPHFLPWVKRLRKTIFFVQSQRIHKQNPKSDTSKIQHDPQTIVFFVFFFFLKKGGAQKPPQWPKKTNTIKDMNKPNKKKKKIFFFCFGFFGGGFMQETRR